MAKKKFDFSKSREQAKKDLQTGNKDPRFWTLVDKENNKVYEKRFVPSTDEDNALYLKWFQHDIEYYKDGKKKYHGSICPKMYGRECAFCDHASDLYDDGNKDCGGKMKQKMKILTNTYMIDDPVTIDNNGKNFMEKMSIQAFEKVLNQIDPNDVLAHKMKKKKIEYYNPYDIYDACSFDHEFVPAGKNYPHRKNSEFETDTGMICKTEKETTAVFENAFDLVKYVKEQEKDCPSFEQQEKTLNIILSADDNFVVDGKTFEQEDSSDDAYDEPPKVQNRTRKPVEEESEDDGTDDWGADDEEKKDDSEELYDEDSADGQDDEDEKERIAEEKRLAKKKAKRKAEKEAAKKKKEDDDAPEESNSEDDESDDWGDFD